MSVDGVDIPVAEVSKSMLFSVGVFRSGYGENLLMTEVAGY